MQLDIALAALIVGFAVGMTGMGGGALMTPMLVLLFKVQPLAAVSSDLVASLVMKPFGAAVHLRSRTVRWPIVGWLCVGSVPAAFLGVVVLRQLGRGQAVQNIISLALGAVVLLAVGAMVVKTLIDRRQGGAPAAEATVHARPLPLVTLGAAVGFIVGITSVGSGTIVIIALLFMYPRLTGSSLVGTDLTQAIPMVGSAALAHILFGDFRLVLTASIVAGSVPGAVLGALISSRVPTRAVRAALAVVLVTSGLKLVGVPTVGLAVGAGATLVVAAAALIVGSRRQNLAPASR